jgi:serine/threonine protein kinase
VIEKTFGRYKVVGELGRGAMGAVYRAVDPLIERDVAIKTLLPNVAEEADMAEVRERFIREARSAGRLNHPNIVTIFDVGEQNGVAYIAMELLDGRSLQQMLRDGHKFPYHVAAELAAQVADGLDLAQQYKIVHRDVKPANIMVNGAGRAKLTDFGVARVDSSSMTQTGAALGSPKYMSPEQVLGQPIDPRSDIFSLGVVFYEMLTRKTPFERDTDTTVFSMMNRIAGEPHLPARKLDPQVPPIFDHILNRVLAKKPELRYQRAAELANDLRNWKTLDPRKVGMTVPAPAAATYDKTQKLAPGHSLATTVNRAETPEEEKARAQLMNEMERFTKNFDNEEQARVRAEQEAQVRRAADLQRWGAVEEQKREQFQRQRDADSSQSIKQGALDALRRQAGAAPAKEDKGAARAKAVTSLDEGMRKAFKYFEELTREINQSNPVSNRSYEFNFLGKVPAVELSDARVHQRDLHVDGRNVFESVQLKFRVTPENPAKTSVTGEDILRCKQYLETLGTEFKAAAEERNKAGKITRAQFTVSGSLPCEINLRADYVTAGAVMVEILNVRRVGRTQTRIPAALLGDVVDDLARYAIGVDDDFEKVLKLPSK